MKASVLKPVIQTGIKANEPVLITGAPGIGKSDIVAEAAAEADARLIISHPVVSDPTDFKGLPWAGDGKTATFLPFGDLAELIKADSLTVYFLDDLGQAPPSVQAAAMQLLLARRINGHAVSEHVRFIAATNRKSDRAGVSGVLEPVKSRFASIIELEVDLEDWVKWALSHSILTEIIAFLRFKPALLHDFKPTGEIKNSPCPRTWAKLSAMLQAGPPEAAEFDIAQGAVGEGAAGEFMAFRRIYHRLPNVDRILMDPDKAEIPEAKEPAVLYALCGALAAKASEQTFDRIVRYGNRLPDEFSVLLIKDSCRSAENPNALYNTRAFIEWSSKHSDVLI